MLNGLSLFVSLHVLERFSFAHENDFVVVDKTKKKAQKIQSTPLTITELSYYFMGNENHS